VSSDNIGPTQKLPSTNFGLRVQTNNDFKWSLVSVRIQNLGYSKCLSQQVKWRNDELLSHTVRSLRLKRRTNGQYINQSQSEGRHFNKKIEFFCPPKSWQVSVWHGGSRPGPGGRARAPHFLSSPPPQFFHWLLIIAPHSALGGPPPSTVYWLEPPLVFGQLNAIQISLNRSFQRRVFPGNQLPWYWKLRITKRKYTENQPHNKRTGPCYDK